MYVPCLYFNESAPAVALRYRDEWRDDRFLLRRDDRFLLRRERRLRRQGGRDRARGIFGLPLLIGAVTLETRGHKKILRHAALAALPAPVTLPAPQPRSPADVANDFLLMLTLVKFVRESFSLRHFVFQKMDERLPRCRFWWEEKEEKRDRCCCCTVCQGVVDPDALGVHTLCTKSIRPHARARHDRRVADPRIADPFGGSWHPATGPFG